VELSFHIDVSLRPIQSFCMAKIGGTPILGDLEGGKEVLRGLNKWSLGNSPSLAHIPNTHVHGIAEREIQSSQLHHCGEIRIAPFGKGEGLKPLLLLQ
jgi:hypothetical protein